MGRSVPAGARTSANQHSQRMDGGKGPLGKRGIRPAPMHQVFCKVACSQHPEPPRAIQLLRKPRLLRHGLLQVSVDTFGGQWRRRRAAALSLEPAQHEDPDRQAGVPPSVDGLCCRKSLHAQTQGLCCSRSRRAINQHRFRDADPPPHQENNGQVDTGRCPGYGRSGKSVLRLGSVR